MSTTQGGAVRKVWYFWKSLHLPWRKRFYVGQDIQGNTYYELRQPRGDSPPTSTSPYRRIVYYPRSTPLSEVKVPPAWHQWLRHQRATAPTLPEQMAELQRQARIKVLAAEADARWEAKPSLLDMPPKPETKTKAVGDAQQQSPRGDEQEQVGSRDRQTSERIQETARGERGRERGKDDIPSKQPDPKTNPPDPDPWKQAQRGAPGETWQPEAWTPAPAKKR
ncbi:hypothetical protein F4777DRAFT_296110 [Nemania sp. FL0916]|nr:hypothetical protein F4777DRAFT_296110 [Nemania sp. FL0916]